MPLPSSFTALAALAGVASSAVIRMPFARLAQHLLPATCALCGGTAPANVCEPCSDRHLRGIDASCVQCGIPLAVHAPTPLRCGACLRESPGFDHTIAATTYAAPADSLVLALKFGARLALAPTIAGLLHARITASGTPLPDVITPVPLAPARLAARGFNQALEIARPLSRRLGIALMPRLLVRVRDTRPQSALLPEERRRNVREAFTVAPAAMAALRGRHVAVVDDVMTTGETLAEIAGVLKRFGAARVTNVVFARTPPKN